MGQCVQAETPASRGLVPALPFGCVEALLCSGFGAGEPAVQQAAHTLLGTVATFHQGAQKSCPGWRCGQRVCSGSSGGLQIRLAGSEKSAKARPAPL